MTQACVDESLKLVSDSDGHSPGAIPQYQHRENM